MDRTKRYPLTHVLFIALAATLTGDDGWLDMERFARVKQPWLEKFFPLPHGTPSKDTFRRVLEALRPGVLAERFSAWINALHDGLEGQHIAIDGKAIRGAVGKADDGSCLYVLHVWATELKLLLGMKLTEGAPGEAKAADEVLATLELVGATVTGDANFCTQGLARRICEQGAEYLFTLKGNRGPVHQDVRELFERKRAHRSHRIRSRGRGRDELRIVRVLSAENLSPERRAKWSGLKTLVHIERTRTVYSTGETQHEVHYALTSMLPDAKRIARFVRRHWSVENELHFVLDTSMNEDLCRIRDKNSAACIAVLRRMAHTLMTRPDAGKDSMRGKRKTASLDDDYRRKLLTAGFGDATI